MAYYVSFDKAEDSQACASAQTMPLEMKMRKILVKKIYLVYLQPGHHVFEKCRSSNKCLICGKKHVALMCPELTVNKKVLIKMIAIGCTESITEGGQIQHDTLKSKVYN